METARQTLHVLSEDAHPKVDKPSGTLFLSVADSDAYGTDEKYDGGLDIEDCNLNDADSTSKGFVGVCAWRGQVRFSKVQEMQRTAWLLVPKLF